jgi:hypothetical protein
MLNQPDRFMGPLVAGLMIVLALAGVLAMIRELQRSDGQPELAPLPGRYSSEVTAVHPLRRGLRVRLSPTGEVMTVENRTGQDVVVLGYSGEAYLRITSAGVLENVRSMMSLLDRAAQPGSKVVLSPSAMAAARTAAPQWRRVSTEPVATWRDRRTHWFGVQPPSSVRQRPDRSQAILDWAVPLEMAGRPVRVLGRLSWIGPTGDRGSMGWAGQGTPGMTGADGWR